MNSFDTTAPWAIQPEQLLRIQNMASDLAKTNGPAMDAAALGAKAANNQMGLRVTEGVAVIDLVGVLTKDYSWTTAMMGGTSMQTVGALLNQARTDPNIKGILLRIDSPGGTVDGVEILAKTIRATASEKAVYALASGAIASAAYWAGSAASALYLESGTTAAGSIGIVSAHRDISALESRVGVKTTEISSGKFKRIASMYEPLSAEGRDTIQAQLDQMYGLFVEAVAQHRQTTVQNVLDRMADGRIFIGQNAINVGLADGFATESELMQRLGTGQAPQKTLQPNRTQKMNAQQINEEAFRQVGPNGSQQDYATAIAALTAQANSLPEDRCARTGLSAQEKVNQAEAYAKKHGVGIVQAYKDLDFAH